MGTKTLTAILLACLFAPTPINNIGARASSTAPTSNIEKTKRPAKLGEDPTFYVDCLEKAFQGQARYATQQGDPLIIFNDPSKGILRYSGEGSSDFIGIPDIQNGSLSIEVQLDTWFYHLELASVNEFEKARECFTKFPEWLVESRKIHLQGEVQALQTPKQAVSKANSTHTEGEKSKEDYILPNGEMLNEKQVKAINHCVADQIPFIYSFLIRPRDWHKHLVDKFGTDRGEEVNECVLNSGGVEHFLYKLLEIPFDGTTVPNVTSSPAPTDKPSSATKLTRWNNGYEPTSENCEAWRNYDQRFCLRVYTKLSKEAKENSQNPHDDPSTVKDWEKDKREKEQRRYETLSDTQYALDCVCSHTDEVEQSQFIEDVCQDNLVSCEILEGMSESCEYSSVPKNQRENFKDQYCQLTAQ